MVDSDGFAIYVRVPWSKTRLELPDGRGVVSPGGKIPDSVRKPALSHSFNIHSDIDRIGYEEGRTSWTRVTASALDRY
jgi:hypothetical protein